MTSGRRRAFEKQDGDASNNHDPRRRIVSYSEMPDNALKVPPYATPLTSEQERMRRDSTRTSGTRRKTSGSALYVAVVLLCVVSSCASVGYLLLNR